MKYLRAKLSTAVLIVLSVAMFLVLVTSSRDKDILPFPRNVAMGFPVEKYENCDQYVAHLRSLNHRYPDLFDYQTDRKTYGSNYGLYWVTVGDTNKPAFFIVSVLHAKHEWQGAHIVLHFIEKILDPNDNQREFNTALLQNFCIVAVPMVNTWGYFASPDGKHYNKHAARVKDINKANWHDMTHYDYYYGVNLNRNFDWNWDTYPNLPFSVKQYWRGTDYGSANYFMMPFYINENGAEVYDPQNMHPNHILKPDLEVYDYKGEKPFSEPETQLIQDLFGRHRIVGFIDWHLMNPWQTNNASYISRHVDRQAMVRLIDEGIQIVKQRHKGKEAQLPPTQHIIMEEYDHNAPYSVNWAQNRMGVKSFGWETGTGFPVEVWTDAYMEIFYRALYWMQHETDQTSYKQLPIISIYNKKGRPTSP